MTDLPDQTGRTVIVTGANVGLGKATTRALARHGAHVVMASRNEAKALAARQELIGTGIDPGRLSVRRLDLGDQASVRRFAETFLGEHDRLDLLINNAGLSGTRCGKTVDGFETQFGVNHLGHMALTLLLLPTIVATPSSRVVTVSSGAHRFGQIRFDDPNFDRGKYRAFSAYAQSKLANFLFSAELGRRLEAAGHRSISAAADPGFVRTELGTKDASRTQRLVMRVSFLIVPSHSAETGAGPTLRAATDPNAVNGQLYAPRLGVRGVPVLQQPSRRTTGDLGVAARLWDLSLDLLGLEPPAVLAPAAASGNRNDS
jgi:NAD(P)-dependent dehydrogenase (short-subunit alcohol dehydrogenase family)